MKKHLIFLALVLSFYSLNIPFTFGQQFNDLISWKISTSKSEVKVGDEVELILTSTIKDTWHLYSSDFEDGGPMVSKFNFTKNNTYKLLGEVKPVNAKEKYDDIFEMNVRYFTKKAEFRQKVKVLSKNPNIKVNFKGQVCSDESGNCVQQEEDFTFKIKVVGGETESSKKDDENNDEEEDNEEEDNEENDDEEDNESESNEEENLTASNDIENQNNNIEKDKIKAENAKPAKNKLEKGSLWGFILLSFLAGFAALLTPCVFPMIPMTVSFFSKEDKKKDTEGMTEEEIQALERMYRRKAIKRGVIYGLSIIGIYTLLGVVFSKIFGESFAYTLSTHWIPNLIFFVILVVFALSFLGMFEIVLPSSWVNQSDKQVDKGGYIGIFFMALTLALVSFSCTFPVVGTVLITSANGEFIRPVLGMLAFSSAIAIPFTLFAVFPTWLNSLPKSGGWLNSVKVILGFLELALALKFLSQADLAQHWGLLDRDIFLALWIVIFAVMGLYLLGKVRLPHDSKLEKIPVPRLVLAILSLSFVIYMIPGLFGAPLKPLAGYLPPQTTQDFNLLAQSGSQISNNTLAENKNEEDDAYSELKFPPGLGLEGFFDYKEAIAYAKKVDKPVFIDFTGHTCANCRKMEENVWPDKKVLKQLKNDYVVVALYTDDVNVLPKDRWYKSKRDKKMKKTIGEQNLDFQITRFNYLANPFYCLINPQTEELIIEPLAYEPDIDKFASFLDKGKKVYQKSKKIAHK